MWLPPKVSEDLKAESRQYAAEVLDSVARDETMERWDRELKAIDSRLFLVKAKESVTPGTALRPGFWHILRDNEGAPPTVMTLEGRNGEYVEPSSQVFDKLRENDLWHSEVAYERKRRQRELDDRRERMRQEEREERQQEIYERFLANTRAQVSMNDSTPWTQNANGRRAK